jgi:glycosyltransferase involved in cell wall biosynthesis
MKILVITYHYAPEISGAIPRRTMLEKYLLEQGHEVTLVSPQNRIQGVHGARHIAVPWAQSPAFPRRNGRVERFKHSFVGRGLRFVKHLSWLPDPVVRWTRLALKKLVPFCEEWTPDLLITNSPPESVHMLGLTLSKRFGIPVIADFCDGWTFESTRGVVRIPIRLQLERGMESSVVKQAKYLLFATRPILKEMAGRFPKMREKFIWLPSGFEPFAGSGDDAIPNSRCEFLYAGRFLASNSRRHPSLFFDPLRRALAARPEMRNKIKVTLIGDFTVRDRKAWERADLADVVAEEPIIRPDQLTARLSRAAVLVLVTAPHMRSIATRKVYDYLSAKRPILALARGNEAEKIITETRSGLCVPGENPDAVARSIIDMWRFWQEGTLEEEFPCSGNDLYRAQGHFDRVFSRIFQELDCPPVDALRGVACSTI